MLESKKYWNIPSTYEYKYKVMLCKLLNNREAGEKRKSKYSGEG
jgi:hypothetical protein